MHTIFVLDLVLTLNELLSVPHSIRLIYFTQKRKQKGDALTKTSIAKMI